MRMVLVFFLVRTHGPKHENGSSVYSGLHTGSEHDNGFLVFSGLHTGPEHENGPEYEKGGFLCFPVCTQILNMGQVFFVFRSAHRS